MNPNGMIASVDTDKHVSSPAAVHSLESFFSQICGKVMVYNLGLSRVRSPGLRGVLRDQTYIRMTWSTFSSAGAVSASLKQPDEGTRASLMVSDVHVHRSQLARLVFFDPQLSVSGGVHAPQEFVHRLYGLEMKRQVIITHDLHQTELYEWVWLTHALVEHVGLVS